MTDDLNRLRAVTLTDDERGTLREAAQTVYRRHNSNDPLNHVNTVEWVDAATTAVESIVAARVAYYDELIASANRIITAHTDRAERAETERDELRTRLWNAQEIVNERERTTRTAQENHQWCANNINRIADERDEAHADLAALRAAVTNLADELETNNCVCGGCGACDNEIHLVPRLRSLLSAAPTETEETPDE